jgi:hypothetical protein
MEKPGVGIPVPAHVFEKIKQETEGQIQKTGVAIHHGCTQVQEKFFYRIQRYG